MFITDMMMFLVMIIATTVMKTLVGNYDDHNTNDSLILLIKDQCFNHNL